VYVEFSGQAEYQCITDYSQRILTKLAHLHAVVDLTPDELTLMADIKAAVAALPGYPSSVLGDMPIGWDG
jgi:hypothetical protein